MYYAVGYRGWVEVRKASAPLKTRRSIIKIKTEHKEVELNREGKYHLVSRERISKVPLTTVTGGTVLHTMRQRDFYAITGRVIPIGQALKLTDTIYEQLKRNVS